MAPSLKQEVNLSRRACRQEQFFRNKNIYNNNNNNLKLNQSICNHNNLLNNLTGAKIMYNDSNTNINNYDNSNYRDINNNNNNNFSQLHNNKLNYININLNDSVKNKKNMSYSINRISVVLVLIGLLFYSTNLCADARPNGTQAVETSVETTISPNAIPNDEPKIVVDGVDTKTADGKMANLKEAGEQNHTAPHRYEVSSVDFERVEAPFIISVWILAASIAKIGFHMTPKLHKFFPESCLLIVIGIIVGVILHFATSVHMSPLTPTTFFFYMLPPIILDAGYFMPNRLFFDNLGTILLMAVVGTIFNTGLIGLCLYGCGLTGIYGADVNLPILHIFLFSALISAVDPVAVLAVFEEIHVNEILYIVVFGESLLNDAVTVVLYHMFEAYTEIGIDHVTVMDAVSGVASFFVVALGGTIIGVIWGFATGLVTKYTDHVRVIEPIFIFIMAYLAYLNAEIFHMSGILAITFCGITMKNYVEANISHKSHTTIKYALKMLSSSSETIIFIFLGVATVNNRHAWNTWFVVLTIFFCSVIRSMGVILLTWMANRVRVQQLTNVDKFVISYGGLRGAVAFALVLLIDPKLIPNQPMFVTTTIAVIYFTVFVQGITIGPLVQLLKVKRASKRKPTMNERIHEKVMDHLMAGVEDVIGKTGNYTVRDKFKRFDLRFIRPLLIRDLQSAEPKILETYSKLTMKDAIDIMRRNPSTVGQLTNTESMSALFRNYTGMFGGRLGTSFLGTCPSFSNLENCSRNLDMQELDYNPSKKDLTDAKIHHLLAEELKPYRRHRRLSYSRHAVDDRDLTTQVNYRLQMSTRRMVNDRKHHKRSKRLHKDGSKTNHVSFPEFQQNGSAKQLSNDYINEVLQEGAEDDDDKIGQSDDWEGGLTFTAKSTPMHSPPADEEYDSAYDHENSSSLIAHIANLPGFDTSKARLVKHYYMSKSNSEKEIVPTAAELILPWRRDRSYQSIGSNDTNQHEQFKRLSKDSEGEERTATPTATESVLPWKRGDDDGQDGGAIKQNEFPAWASNKEYLAYNSPSATFLGGLNKPKQVRSVIGLFRRESSGSGSVAGGAPTGSDTSIQLSGLQLHINQAPSSPLPSIAPPATIAAVIAAIPAHRPSTISLGIIPNNSIVNSNSDTNDPLGALNRGHTGPFPVTASHRRNNRRGSLLELSGEPIPEENYTKSLPEREKYGVRRTGQQPLLKLTTPRSNRHINPQNVALLSSSSTESDDDDDDDDEDHDDYNEDGGDGLKMKNI